MPPKRARASGHGPSVSRRQPDDAAPSRYVYTPLLGAAQVLWGVIAAPLAFARCVEQRNGANVDQVPAIAFCGIALCGARFTRRAWEECGVSLTDLTLPAVSRFIVSAPLNIDSFELGGPRAMLNFLKLIARDGHRHRHCLTPSVNGLLGRFCTEFVDKLRRACGATPFPHLTDLYVRDEDGPTLFAALKPTLRGVQFDGCDVAAATAGLQGTTRLRRLSFANLNDNVSDDAGELASAISGNALHMLGFRKTSISSVALSRILRSAGRQNGVGTLRTLKLSDSSVSGNFAVVADVLFLLPLKRLSLFYCGVTDEQAAHIAAVLRRPGCQLEDLDLYENRIGPAGAKAIAEAFTVNSSLRVLCLRHNRVLDDGGVALAEGLAHNKSLVALDLATSGVTRRTHAAFAATRLSNTTLAELTLPPKRG